MRFTLDSNILIAWLRRGDRVVVRRLRAHYGEFAVSSIVMHELYFGAFNSARLDRNLAELGERGLPILDFDADDARAAGEVRATLRRAGTPIGPYDILIAGQALARGLILVTNNTREFARVDGLKLEDWTAA